MTRYYTSAFLSPFGPKHFLEIDDPPSSYGRIIVKEYSSGIVVEPSGFKDEVPYFSEEFYQRKLKKHDEIIKYDKESARNVFWFDVMFEDVTLKE